MVFSLFWLLSCFSQQRFITELELVVAVLLLKFLLKDKVFILLINYRLSFSYPVHYDIFKIEKSLQLISSTPKVQVPSSPALLAPSGMKFSCDKCSYFTNRESKMEEHMTAHGGRWICSVCNKAFVKVKRILDKNKSSILVRYTLHRTFLF